MKLLSIFILSTSFLFADTWLVPLYKCIKDNYYYSQQNGRFYYQFSGTENWLNNTSQYNETQLRKNFYYDPITKNCYPPEHDKNPLKLKEEDYQITISNTDILIAFGSLVLFGALISTTRYGLSLIRS